MKERIAIYPFHPELYPYVQHFDAMQSQRELTAIYSLPGLAPIGEDAAQASRMPPCGHLVRGTDSQEPFDWDTLYFFPRPAPKPSHERRTLGRQHARFFKHLCEAGKQIHYHAHSPQDLPKECHELAGQYPERIAATYAISMAAKDLAAETLAFERVPCPVLLFGGLVQTTASTQMALRAYLALRQAGHRPLLLGRHAFAEILGAYQHEFLFAHQAWRPAECISHLNHYLANLVNKHASTALLLEAPDALMRYSDLAPNGFAIESHMLCQAQPIDALFVNVPGQMASKQLMQKLSKGFQERWDVPITGVCLDPVAVDGQEILQSKTISYTRLPTSLLDQPLEELSKEKTPAYFSLHPPEKQAFEDLILGLFQTKG